MVDEVNSPTSSCTPVKNKLLSVLAKNEPLLLDVEFAFD